MAEALGLLPVACFLAALVLLDSYKLVRLRFVVGVVVAGMVAAGIAYWLNGELLRYIEFTAYTRYFAPQLEELLKGAVIVALVRAHRVGFLVDAAICGFAVGAVGSVLRSARLADFSPEQLSFLTYGRGVDTSRMREQLGFEPAFSTEAAFADFAAGLTPTGGRIEKVLTAALDQLGVREQAFELLAPAPERKAADALLGRRDEHRPERAFDHRPADRHPRAAPDPCRRLHAQLPLHRIVEPRRGFETRVVNRPGDGIAARIQGHIVTGIDQCFGEYGNHALGAAVQLRRYALD